MDKYFEAIDFAQNAHKGQYRKGSHTPYIVHPLSVMEILIRNNAKEEVAIAGVLHDVVEDTEYTLEDIRERFGERVAKLVSYASEPHKDAPWKNRKEHTIELLRTLDDKDALYVICADKYHNICSMIKDYEILGDMLWSKFKYGREDQKWYYKTVAEILLSHDEEDDFFKRYMEKVKKFFG
ncbi:MAG: HD domain-containing protein [Lactobacillaceae bacterium]|nr:HD domain-containing protein [Lactobacillaceae bacterium]